jgi:uncharacterized cupredoxin-like copper-binding protein
MISPKPWCHLPWIGLCLGAFALAALGTAGPAPAAGTVRDLTLVMREFSFQPTTLRLKAGEEVVLTIRNEGKADHEWSAGREAILSEDEKGYRQDLFDLLKVTATGRGFEMEPAGTPPGASEEQVEAETIPRISSEVDLAPGGEVTLHFRVPASARGKWEMGSFVPGDYESNMNGYIVIE